VTQTCQFGVKFEARQSAQRVAGRSQGHKDVGMSKICQELRVYWGGGVRKRNTNEN